MMRISARNVFKGTVTDVKEGPVSAQVQVDIGGGNTVTATITTDAVRDLGIATGGEVHVVVKASQVMLAVD